MILYANVDDLALIINDVLPKDLFQKVSSYDYENIKNRKRNVNHKDWQETLHKDDYKNKTMEQVRTVDSIATYHKEKYDFVDVIFKDVLDIIINCEWLPFQKNSSLSLSYYEYYKYAGINWHDDHGWKYGATFYINHKWQKQWGGEFMFTDDNGHGWIPPVGNSLVIIKAPLEHKVNPILSPIIPRISIQIFMK